MLRAVLSASGYLIFALCESAVWMQCHQRRIAKKICDFCLTRHRDLDSLEKFAQNVTRF